MLSSTKRYILHAISLCMAIACLTAGLVMKYDSASQDVPVVVQETEAENKLEYTSLRSDSLNMISKRSTVSNPDD